MVTKGKGVQPKRWHVNPKSGEVGLCNATIRTCPFGGATGTENHYESREVALVAAEKTLEKQYGGNLPENASKTLAANKTRMVIDGKPDPVAAEFTDDLVTMGWPARLSGKTVNIDFISKNDAKPLDEFGDLTASATYIPDGNNAGKWLFKTVSPKNAWYGSSRLFYSSGDRILTREQILSRLDSIEEAPDLEVERIRALSKDGW